MKILEISRSAAASYAGLLLAELGNEVYWLDQRESAAQADPFLHRNKVRLEQLSDLDAYDAIVEDVGPDKLLELQLSERILKRDYPQLVVVSLSPYGHGGPYGKWQATDLTVQAVGGVMHMTGYDGEAPQKLPGESAAMIAGLHGATAVLAAVLAIESGNDDAVHIDISAQDTLMQHWTRHISMYAYSGIMTQRAPRDPRGIPACNTAMSKDGWLFLLALRVPWQDIAAFLGLAEFVRPGDPASQPWDEMQDAFHAAVASRDKYDWFTDAAGMGWTFAPIEDPFDVATNPQTCARESFTFHDFGDESLLMPKLPFRTED